MRKVKSVIGRIICVLLLLGYGGLVLYLTVLGRSYYPEDPLGVVLGGWDCRMVEDGGDVHAFYNLFMLTPVTFLLPGVFPRQLRHRKFAGHLRTAVLVSFGISLAIEVTQTILHVGTLQISDLVYNTCSGVLGTAAYCLMRFLFSQGKQTAQPLEEPSDLC